MSETPAGAPAPLSRRLITDQILARLTAGLAPVQVFDAELLDRTTGQPVTAPVITGPDGQPDPSGRVAKHTVLYPWPGDPSTDADLADAHVDLDLIYQVNAIAGWRPDCEQLIDDVDAVLHRWAPVIEGAECSGMRPPVGFRPGAIRRIDAERPAPPRFWVPLQYQLRITR